MKPGGIAGKEGSIIHLSSLAGLIGVPGFSVYGGTKGLVRIMSKHLATEFGKLGYGIRVNSIHPGLIKSAMGDAVFDRFVDLGFASTVEEAAEAVMQSTPLGSLGQVEDIAAGAVYLASDASRYVSGIELPIDGGWSAS